MIRFSLTNILVLACVQVFGQQRSRTNQNRPPNFIEFRTKIDRIQNPDSTINEIAQFAKNIVNRYPDSTLLLAKQVMNFDKLSLLKRKAYQNYILTFYWDRPNPDSALLVPTEG